MKAMSNGFYFVIAILIIMDEFAAMFVVRHVEGGWTFAALHIDMMHVVYLSSVCNILALEEGKQCIVIGTIYKQMQLKPSVLDEYSKEVVWNSTMSFTLNCNGM